MNILIMGALGGMFGSIIGLIINNVRAKNALSANIMSIKDYKSKDKSSIETIFTGDYGSFEKLNSSTIKFIEYVDVRKLNKNNSMEDLPFDHTKELVIFSENNVFGYELHKALTKRGLKYSYLGRYKDICKDLEE